MNPFLHNLPKIAASGGLHAKRRRFRLFCTTVFLALATSAADASVIRGRVLDASSNTFLQGAEVRVVETGESVFTDRGGDFRFRGMALGEYTLEARFTGYPAARATVLVDDPNSEVFTTVSLGQSDVIDLDDFVITAGLLGQAKAISVQRSSDNLRNVVSADAFGEFVDRNAAEAMQRVVGVAVEDSQGEGRFVLIRGADRNLSTVAIDGVQVATPEEGGRATGLNLIAIEQLESIEVVKSWVPNQPANFIGGAVNLITRSALDRDGQFMSLDFGYGQYDISDKSSYKVSAVYGNVWGSQRARFGFQVSLNHSVDNRGSETLRGGSWVARVTAAVRFSPDGFRLNTQYLDDYEIERERTGASTKLELRLNDRHTFAFSASYNRFNDDEVRQTVRQNPSTAANNYYGARTLTEANALRLGYDLTDPAVAARVYAPTAAQRLLTFEEAIELGDLAYDFDRKAYTYSIWRGGAFRQWQSSVATDEITTAQFFADHRLSESFNLDYRVHYSEASKDDHRQFMQMNPDSDNNTIITLEGNKSVMIDQQGIINDPDRFRISESTGSIRDDFVFSEDKRYGTDVNLSFEWDTDRITQRVTGGLYYDAREKSFRRDFNRFSQIRTGGLPRISMSDPIFFGGFRENFLREINVDGEYDFGPVFDTEKTRDFINNPGEFGITFEQVRNDITFTVSDAFLRDYDATEDVSAGYLMHTLDFGKFRVIAGLRYERTKNTFTNNDILTRGESIPVPFAQPGFWPILVDRLGPEAFIIPIENSRSYDHLLPALHVIYRPTDRLVIRSAITKTIARPDFNDLVPREIVGVSGAFYSNSVRLPNLELMPLESINYDLSADYYFERFGYVSIGLFHKDLDGPIYTETSLVEGGPLADYLNGKYRSDPVGGATDWVTTREVNAGKGKISGLEFTYEQRFTFLPGPLSALGATFNFALMNSSVRLPDDASARANEKVRLFRQPDRLANLSLFWERYGFLVRASAVYRGTYADAAATTGVRIDELVSVGLPLNSYDVFFDSSLRVDLLVRYRMRNGLQIYFEGTNLTNEPVKSYFGEEWRIHRIRYTRPVYFVGARYSF